MEIKAKLLKPFSTRERSDFITVNNHRKGYEIKETDESLEAWGLTAEEQEEKNLQDKKDLVRGIRNKYLETYVDPYQLVIRWGDLTEEEQTDLKSYRQYLLDYTKEDEWWNRFPMDFDTWKGVNNG